MKKFFAILLSAMLMLSLAVPAMAAEGDVYEIYQIFTGDLSGKVLSNVKWGKNGTGTEGEAVSDTILNALAGVNNGTDAEQLVVIEQYADLTGTPFTTGAADTYTLPNGYYLIKHVDGSQEDEGDFYTLYVVMIVNNSLIITPKGDAPKVEKTVNDTDLSIGDTVTFTLTATMPSTFEGYDSYKVVFHDTMYKGLTYNEDAEASVDGFTAASGTDEAGNTTITITNDNVLDNGATAGSTITVTYTATLNSDAVIGTEGNPNEVYLEYSNDPNWDGKGIEPTGNTPKDDVKVYTWDMEVLKYADGNEGNVLAGVKFILLNKDQNKIAKVADGKIVSWDTSYTEGMDVTAYELTTDANGKISIDGLESGTYYLRETQELAGYNKLSGDVTVTVDNNSDGSYATYIAKVNNQSGATLPETGGIGTTIFYIVGGLMVVGAVVLLVTKKRMSAEG